MIKIINWIKSNLRCTVVIAVALVAAISIIVLNIKCSNLFNKYNQMVNDYETKVNAYEEEMIVLSQKLHDQNSIIEKYENDAEQMTATINNQAKQIDDLNEQLGSKAQRKLVNGSYAIPTGHNSFKSYMPYNCLSQYSGQWKLVSQAVSDENGLMKIGEYYVVAMGSYYVDSIGDKFIITLDSGKVFKVIIGDLKADCHTDANNMYTVANDCMMEFLVDTAKLTNPAKIMGDISYAGFSGDIIKVEKEN